MWKADSGRWGRPRCQWQITRVCDLIAPGEKIYGMYDLFIQASENWEVYIDMGYDIMNRSIQYYNVGQPLLWVGPLAEIT